MNNFDFDWIDDINAIRVLSRIREKEANLLAIDWEKRLALVDKPWEAWFAPRIVKW